ncbi:MAG: nicotinate phosphoribosyltransferase [Acidobacteria bacterium]|nr:nicotinate phosphoribosyltransferase [Acidobacteriota bacterium]
MTPLKSPSSALLTDLYELTMAAAYFERRLDCRATFELFIRSLPPERGYLVAAGIDAAVDYLEDLRFTERDIRFLREHPAFRTISSGFFKYLRTFRFSGEVSAVEEGSLIFAEEPVLQVTAPVIEAQVVETYLLSLINFETLVASKAARIVGAARGRRVLEFGSRRAHGPEAGVRAARAAYVGGCDATSNVMAGCLFSIPIAGTAAHSWTQVFPSERESFEALLETFPETAILLIDTYDPMAAAEIAVSLGRPVPGVRIDSGDLLDISRRVREILDRRGASATKIVASGDLNEDKIESLVQRGAPIDSFGVGTDLSTSRDAPALNVVYKLVETERGGLVDYKAKFSPDKIGWPGRKQVFRFLRQGKMDFDLIARASETHPEGEPLLRRVMENGRRVAPHRALAEVRAAAMANLMRLPKAYRALRTAPEYPVRKSTALQELLDKAREQLAAGPRGSTTS